MIFSNFSGLSHKLFLRRCDLMPTLRAECVERRIHIFEIDLPASGQFHNLLPWQFVSIFGLPLVCARWPAGSEKVLSLQTGSSRCSLARARNLAASFLE
jgi:hypothetical protein